MSTCFEHKAKGAVFFSGRGERVRGIKHLLKETWRLEEREREKKKMLAEEDPKNKSKNKPQRK